MDCYEFILLDFTKESQLASKSLLTIDALYLLYKCLSDTDSFLLLLIHAISFIKWSYLSKLTLPNLLLLHSKTNQVKNAVCELL